MKRFGESNDSTQTSAATNDVAVERCLSLTIAGYFRPGWPVRPGASRSRSHSDGFEPDTDGWRQSPSRHGLRVDRTAPTQPRDPRTYSPTEQRRVGKALK